MYILIKGELIVTSAQGKEYSRIKPGGIVGEMGILTDKPRSASVVTATDCIVISINKNEFINLLKKDTVLTIRILINIINDLSEKLRNDNIIIEELKQTSFIKDIPVNLHDSLSKKIKKK